MSKQLYSKIERLKNFIKFFIVKYQPVCCFCGGKISWLTFFPNLSGHWRDELTIHHKEHDRSKNEAKDLALSHRDCHKRHHREEQLVKETEKTYTYTCYESINGVIKEEKITV